MRIEAVPGPPPTALVANLPYNVSVPVLIHLLESLGRVSGVEHRPERLAALRRHAGLVLEAGRRTIEDRAGLADFERRRASYFPTL